MARRTTHGAPRCHPAARDLGHELALDVAAQASRGTPAIAVGLVAVTVLQYGVMADWALALWVALALADLARHHWGTRRSVRNCPAHTVGEGRWTSVVGHLCFGLVWGSHALLAGLAGGGPAMWTATIVTLAVLSMYVATTSASRPLCLVGVAGLVAPSTAGLLLIDPPATRHALGIAAAASIAVLVHDIVHRSLVEAYEAKLANARLAERLQQELSERDPVTGLFNRKAFTDRLAVLLEGARDEDRELVLVVGNVRRLTTVNELHGEAVGTAMLIALGERLGAAGGDGVAAARIGGDEFAAVVARRRETARPTPSALFQLVARDPVEVDGLRLPVAWHLVETVVDGSQTAAEALAATTARLRELRNRAPAPHPAEGDATVGERRALTARLLGDLAEAGVEAWFQPIVCARTREVLAWEALARWPQPGGELLLPHRFLPLVVASGLQQRLLQLLVCRSARFLGELAAENGTTPALHLNLTPHDLRTPGTGAWLVSTFADSGIDPVRLVVELSEQDILQPDDTVRDNLAVLTEAGAHLAVDDFGTGYSSLSHLLDLPTDHLKIDRRFVAGLLEDPRHRQVVHAVLGLAQGMGLRTIAEGVETDAQADVLAALGCSQLQGFLVAPALPAAAALQFTRARQRGAVASGALPLALLA